MKSKVIVTLSILALIVIGVVVYVTQSGKEPVSEQPPVTPPATTKQAVAACSLILEVDFAAVLGGPLGRYEEDSMGGGSRCTASLTSSPFEPAAVWIRWSDEIKKNSDGRVQFASEYYGLATAALTNKQNVSGLGEKAVWGGVEDIPNSEELWILKGNYTVTLTGLDLDAAKSLATKVLSKLE